jgi:glutamate-1-semialdehyde 2,1-aminomutase
MESYLDVYRRKTVSSERFFKRAKEVMPGGVCHNMHYFSPYPLYVKGAKGPKFWDLDGNEYVDLWMGNYTHILGHRSEVIVEAVERQLKEGIHWGLAFEKQVEWAELIRELLPCAEMVRFCCSGTEATMYAVRLARSWTGRRMILKMGGGWHGANTDLSLAVKWPYEMEESEGIPPELQQYAKVIPFNDVQGSLEIITQVKDDLAAIILEPAMGESGFVAASPDYLKMLRSETEKLGALLIFDEVITGFRLSLGGAQERLGMTPDLTTLGKIMGGGLPVGAVAGRREIIEKSAPDRKVKKSERTLVGGGTFSSHPLTAAAGLAMIHYLKDHADEIYPQLDARGQKIREGIQAAMRRHGIRVGVTGVGSLFQTHFPYREGETLNSAQALNQLTDTDRREGEFRIQMLNHGVHVVHGGGALSIAHSDREIQHIIEAAGSVAKEMAQEADRQKS